MQLASVTPAKLVLPVSIRFLGLHLTYSPDPTLLHSSHLSQGPLHTVLRRYISQQQLLVLQYMIVYQLVESVAQSFVMLANGVLVSGTQVEF